MTLHVHKSETDRLNLVEVANDFVRGRPEHRLTVFEAFKSSDMSKQASKT